MTNTEWKDGFASNLEFGLKLWCNVTGNLIAGPGISSEKLFWVGLKFLWFSAKHHQVGALKGLKDCF